MVIWIRKCNPGLHQHRGDLQFVKFRDSSNSNIYTAFYRFFVFIVHWKSQQVPMWAKTEETHNARTPTHTVHVRTAGIHTCPRTSSCKTLKHHSEITAIHGADGVLMSTQMSTTSLGSQLADHYDRPQYYHNHNSISRVENQRWTPPRVFMYLCLRSAKLFTWCPCSYLQFGQWR